MARNIYLQPPTGTDNQRWRFESSNGYYMLENKATGEVMDLDGGQTANDTNIQTYARNGTDAQLFKLTLTNQGLAYFHIIAPKLDNNKLLTAEGNGITSSNINIHDNLNNSYQRFWLRKETDGYYIIFHCFTRQVLGS